MGGCGAPKAAALPWCSEMGAAPAEGTEPQQLLLNTHLHEDIVPSSPSQPDLPKSRQIDIPFTPDNAAFGWKLIKIFTEAESSEG